MKYIAKMMLALLASVTLVIPAYAWDFSASGTMEAGFNSTSTKANSDADTSSAGSGVSSAGSGLTLKSSNTDGDHTSSFSYVADWDGDLDQTITVSGSKKVGKWTGSADVSYNINATGCSNASYAYGTAGDAGDNLTAGDNVTLSAGTVAACAGQQTGEDRGAITLTDGTLTIVLGEASHLSGQNVSTGSSAGGSQTMQSTGFDGGVGAMVGGFHGVSVGYKVSDTISVTGAYQSTGDQNDLLGGMDFNDGETAAYGTTGMGVSASIVAGPATIGVTVGNASTADNSGAGGSLKTTASAMGLGVKIDLGDIDPFISFGSNSFKGSETEAENIHGGSEVGLTYAMGSDTVVVFIGNVSDQVGKDDKPTTYSSMELGYNTTVGPASLKIGYGTKSTADADDTTVDGASYSDLDVTMSLSF